MASKGKSDHYHREAPHNGRRRCEVQMDFMFVGAEGTFVDEPRATATVLMVICKDGGNLSATEVRAKTDECGVEMVLRFLSTFESVEMKTDGEPSIVEIARRVQARRDKNNDSGTDGCWRTPRDWSGGTCEWNSAGAVSSVLPGRARTYESENHSRYAVVSIDVAAFCVEGGALPVRSKNKTDSV